MISAIDPVDKWFLDRQSKFTASVNFKLLPTGKDGTGFSTVGWTYIEEKAIEETTVLWERPELEFVEPLLWGKMYELPAFEEYVSVTRNYSMRHFGTDKPLFLEFNEYSGGSPDGIMGEGTSINCGLEIKCPKNPKNHYKYLKFKSQWDLKESRIEYYCQIQFLLMITKADEFHYWSFDSRWKERKLRSKIIVIKPETKFQDNLELRIAKAQKEKLKIIAELNI